MIRGIVVVLLLSTLLFAEYKTVSIGTIDKHFQNQLNKKELRAIVKEVENHFESKLGFNVFDIKDDGREINILYVKPSLAQKRLDRNIKRYKKKLEQKKDLEMYLNLAKPKVEKFELKYTKELEKTNKLVKEHNKYISKMNKKKDISVEEYNEIKLYDTKQQQIIKKQQKISTRLYKKLKSEQRKYNRKVLKYNNLISSLNSLSKNIESLSRSIKVVKGNAIFNKETIKKSYTRNGQVYKVDVQENIDEKIEIYGFENKTELKTVIAHEIAHLVGIPHINTKGALMNPILQDNQKKRLELTKEDIVNFKKHF